MDLHHQPPNLIVALSVGATRAYLVPGAYTLHEGVYEISIPGIDGASILLRSESSCSSGRRFY